MDPLEIIAENRITLAIEEGVFDNLPGRGQPIHLEQDQHGNRSTTLLHSILVNANVLPHWLELRREVFTEINSTRSEMFALGNIEEQENQGDALGVRIQEINRMISSLNLIAPSPHFQLGHLIEIPSNSRQGFHESDEIPG